ncbi:hypothetical protein N5T78_10310 [Aliarcobacter cryaerophilus]|uniref:hypothetical protein n=1 Tax=Aliarcobacter cryaerophilus TaxID=28198 RepID=UPI0021B57D17|nr:hypothetical protein [Aliarcobacter cryaerophilus]MCT7466974.1 hypothetical protein [Aliarcobacter cryaerophilus]
MSENENKIKMSENENKIKISEDDIQKFIRENDKRKETVLINYKDIIIRLLDTGISKKKIYEFIYEKDNSIGKQINFYKYIERNIENKSKIKKISENHQNKALETQETEKTTQTIIEDRKTTTSTPIINKTATQILSQDYDLLSNAE